MGTDLNSSERGEIDGWVGGAEEVLRGGAVYRDMDIMTATGGRDGGRCGGRGWIGGRDTGLEGSERAGPRRYRPLGRGSRGEEGSEAEARARERSSRGPVQWLPAPSSTHQKIM